MSFTNKYEISGSMAVWLASDDYDYSNDPREISATSLLKPTKQLVLAARAKELSMGDISSRVKPRMGTAIHDSVEHSWLNNYKKAMADLGYSQENIERIIINPLPGQVKENMIPVYLEQRAKKEINNKVVTGKFDIVIAGQLEDIKTTGVYTYIKQTMDDKYRKQGSIYRWLNPDKITNDWMLIQYIFFNWEEFKVSSQKKDRYPPFRMLSEPIKLMSIEETEAFIISKLNELEKYKNTPEPELPLCTADDLWQTESVFSYYKNPAKTKRATKNFKNFYEAHQVYLADGSVGVIKEKQGKVKYCEFCEVFNLCSQKDTYLANGSLVI